MSASVREANRFDFSKASFPPPPIHTSSVDTKYQYIRRIIRPAILKAFSEFQERAQDLTDILNYEDWFVRCAKQFKVPEFWVREFVGEYLDYAEAYSQTAIQGHAKRAAMLVGATLTQAMKTYAEGMAADKKIAYATRDEEGQHQMKFETVPDWPSRIAAADRVTKVFGGYAADKLDVTHTEKREYDELTDEQLERRLETTLLKIYAESKARRSGQGSNGSPGKGIAAPPAGGAGAGGATGAVVDVRPVLLDDAGDQDQGRAGRRKGRRSV